LDGQSSPFLLRLLRYARNDNFDKYLNQWYEPQSKLLPLILKQEIGESNPGLLVRHNGREGGLKDWNFEAFLDEFLPAK